jgi:DNA-directed RNA polymerase subunit K/omega
MQLSKILAEIDVEISRLERARLLLAGDTAPVEKKPRKTKAVEVAAEPIKKKKKRNLSPEGRERIAEAVRRRWELQKKAAAK